MNIAGCSCDCFKLSSAAYNMHLVFGSGYRCIEPCPIYNSPPLQRNDDARELGALRFMESDAVAQPHTVEQRLRYIHALACIQFNHSVVISGSDSARELSERT